MLDFAKAESTCIPKAVESRRREVSLPGLTQTLTMTSFVNMGATPPLSVTFLMPNMGKIMVPKSEFIWGTNCDPCKMASKVSDK